MKSSGILEAIRALVAQGHSSRDLIDRGYAPGSVYLAQRRVRRQISVQRLEDEREAIRQAHRETVLLEEDVHGALAQCREELARAREEAEQMRPLQAWAGHPCAICRQPLHGVVTRTAAARLEKDLAHKRCLEKRERPVLSFEFLERPFVEAE